MSASTSIAPRLGHEQRLAQQRGPVRRWRSTVQCHVRQEREHVLDVHHADHFIERFAIDRQAAVAMLGKGGNHFGKAGRGGNGDDFAARDGDVVGIAFAEMEQVLEHLAFHRHQVAIGALDRGRVRARAPRSLPRSAPAATGHGQAP
jgi:hypothetical protein